MSADPRLSHRLNERCPDCRHAKWLHTIRCLVIRPVKFSRIKFRPCRCRRTAKDFAA